MSLENVPDLKVQLGGDNIVISIEAKANDAVSSLLQSCLDATERLRPLTKRQRDVLTLVSQGHRNKDIAHRLEISQRTVEAHRAQIMKRTHCHSLIQMLRLVIFATELARETNSAGKS